MQNKRPPTANVDVPVCVTRVMGTKGRESYAQKRNDYSADRVGSDRNVASRQGQHSNQCQLAHGGHDLYDTVNEYSGLASVGQLMRGMGTSAAPAATIATQDSNNWIVMESGSLGRRPSRRRHGQSPNRRSHRIDREAFPDKAGGAGRR